MIIITSKYLIPKGYAAMALFPFLLLREARYRQHTSLINHERIHFRQQAELLILPFYLWYLLEYLIRIIRYRNHSVAYRNISFEREAYANEHEPGYLKSRLFWAFLKFL